MNTYGIDWGNINLDNTWERGQCMLDGYDFETLLLEISCNIPTHKLSRETIMQQFEESLQANVFSARVIMADNLDNILNHELKRREDNK